MKHSQRARRESAAIEHQSGELRRIWVSYAPGRGFAGPWLFNWPLFAPKMFTFCPLCHHFCPQNDYCGAKSAVEKTETCLQKSCTNSAQKKKCCCQVGNKNYFTVSVVRIFYGFVCLNALFGASFDLGNSHIAPNYISSPLTSRLKPASKQSILT